MKKRLVAVVLAALIVVSLLAFAGCGNKEPETEKTKFVVGLDASFPPYGYTDDNGEIVGFDIDLAKEVAKRNNWELVAQPIEWAAKDKEIQAGTIDCIWNGFTINGRENDYTWSDPYVDNSQVVVVKKSSGIEKLADLAGKVVSVQDDSSAMKALEDKEKKEMVELLASFKSLEKVKDYNTAFMSLESGAVDAVAMDVGVAKYQINSRQSDEYIILEEIVAPEQYGIGFKLGNTELRDKVQAALDEMMADGTFAKIAETWGLSDSIITK